MTAGPYVIICDSLAGQPPGCGTGVAGQYLASYDPEGNGGYGESAWTANPAAAMTFPTMMAAVDCWMQVPRNRPVRPDGKPNRPLTALTVTFDRVPEPDPPGPVHHPGRT